MRTTLTAIGIAGAICLMFYQGANAIPLSAAAIKDAALNTAAVQQAQYYERPIRHRIIKCYRELVIGPYVCHSFHRW